MKRRNIKQQGFTLTELMIVVALVAIFAVFAVPNMGTAITRQKVQGQAAEIANAFAFAHSEAVRQGKPVFVVPGIVKDDGKLNGKAANWTDANGLLVFANNNADTDRKYDSGEDLRVVSLNSKLKLDKISIEQLGSKPKADHKDDAEFIFYSNGQMRVVASGKLEAPGYIARIVVKDNKRVTKNQTMRFCEVVRVDANGRSYTYTDKRSKLTDSDFFYCE